MFLKKSYNLECNSMSARLCAQIAVGGRSGQLFRCPNGGNAEDHERGAAQCLHSPAKDQTTGGEGETKMEANSEEN